jgi:uncharacterized membrane protein YbhN (UPF0104 family)
MSRARLKTLASIGFLLVIAVLGTWYARAHAHDFRRILEIDAASFAWLSLLCLVAIWILGQHVAVLVAIFNVRLGRWEAFGLAAANTMANFYFTKGGMAAKGLYLKRQHNFPYTHFVSTLAGAYVVTLVTSGALGVIAYGLLAGIHVRFDVMGVFVALIAGGLLPLAIPVTNQRLIARLPRRVVSVIEGWDTVRRHRRRLGWLAALNAAYVIVGGLRLFVSYRALDYNVDLLPCLVISTLQTMTVIFTLTPGGVGIRQALVGYGSEALQIGAAEGVVASTIDHAVGTLWVFAIGLIFTNWLWIRGVRRRRRSEGEES